MMSFVDIPTFYLFYMKSASEAELIYYIISLYLKQSVVYDASFCLHRVWREIYFNSRCSTTSFSNHCAGDAALAYKNYRLSWKQEIASDHVELC